MWKIFYILRRRFFRLLGFEKFSLDQVGIRIIPEMWGITKIFLIVPSAAFSGLKFSHYLLCWLKCCNNSLFATCWHLCGTRCGQNLSLWFWSTGTSFANDSLRRTTIYSCSWSVLNFAFYGFIFLTFLSFLLALQIKYLDGTTDITRTVHFGKPSAHEKACYTAVGRSLPSVLLFLGF